MYQCKTKSKSQSGQGAVELILVMLVTVSIILGVVYQLNDAFGNWAKNYFGEYVSCLLETGELPSLGSSGGISDSQCNTLYEPFTIESGRPLMGAGVGGGGGSSRAGRTAKGSANGGRGSGNSNNLFGGRTSFRSKSRFTPKSRAGGGTATFTGSTDGDIGSLIGARSKKIKTSAKGFRGFESINFADRKKKRVTAKEAKNRKNLSDEGDVKQRAVKMLINRKIAKKVVERKDEELDFGDYLKYLIIIAIIIVLLLFFGNQAMQISKSME